jgi:hypothetical protein
MFGPYAMGVGSRSPAPEPPRPRHAGDGAAHALPVRSIAEEYDRLEGMYGPRRSAATPDGWVWLSQALIGADGRWYDVQRVELTPGRVREVWFEITAFFGV